MRMTRVKGLTLAGLVIALAFLIRQWSRQTLAPHELQHRYGRDSESGSAVAIQQGMQKYKYFCSDGGPFVLMPSELRDKWKGVENMLDPLDPKTDYGKACTITGDFGVIDVRDNQCLVVDAPLMAVDLKKPDKSLSIYLLKQWKSQNLDSMIDQSAEEAENRAFTNTGKTVELKTDQLTFMWAGDVYGNCVYAFTDLNLPNGLYQISTADWQDPNSGHILTVRLAPNSTQ